MVAIVAFASQKGGVGKSTLARALACEVAQDELRVRLADLDTMQHTTADWHTARLQAGLEPVGDVQVFATVQQALKNADSYDLIIIDAPARAPAGTLEIARLATILVQPTNTCEDDRRPAVREFHGLVKHGIPKERLVFALNQVLSGLFRGGRLRQPDRFHPRKARLPTGARYRAGDHRSPLPYFESARRCSYSIPYRQGSKLWLTPARLSARKRPI